MRSTAMAAPRPTTQLYERRRLHLSPTLGGMGVLDGALDAEGTEIVATALDAEMERDLLAPTRAPGSSGVPTRS